MNKIITSILALMILTVTAYGQNYSEQAIKHFDKYLNSKEFLEQCSKSFPTLDDCRVIFKGESADIYYAYTEVMRDKVKEEMLDEPENFLDMKVESFTTSDIEQVKGNYAGGMQKIVDKLQSNLTFYEITLLEEKADEYGVAYKYWVKIDERWVFFPKPWKAFGK